MTGDAEPIPLLEPEPEQTPARRWRWLLRAAFQGVCGGLLLGVMFVLVEFGLGKSRALLRGLEMACVLGGWSFVLALALEPPEDLETYGEAGWRLLKLALLAPLVMVCAIVPAVSIQMLAKQGLNQGLPVLTLLSAFLERPSLYAMVAAQMAVVYGAPLFVLGFLRFHEHQDAQTKLGRRATQYFLAGLCFCFPAIVMAAVDLGGSLLDALWPARARS